jgi:hypothetical protein
MSDHELTIETSRDGGNTFINSTAHDLGTTGKFVKEVKRNRLGQGKQVVFRISVSSPILCPIIAASIQAETDS